MLGSTYGVGLAGKTINFPMMGGWMDGSKVVSPAIMEICHGEMTKIFHNRGIKH